MSLQRILAHDVHLGGESALELAGYYHYLKLGGAQRVHFYGDVPAWLKRLPTQARIRASSPERAILEALDELRGGAGFDNLDKIFGSLTMLRPKLLMELLTTCLSVKVRRLFFVFADRHGHPWLKHLDASVIDFGSGPRALVRGGKIHPAYRIYVPSHFVPGADEQAGFDG